MKKCEMCGCTDQEVLILHHKDGNHKNNIIYNKQTLCANCHLKIHHRKFTRPKDIKKEIFNDERLQIELQKLQERDRAVDYYYARKFHAK